MFRLLLLIIGGALGTLARYGLNGVISEHQSKHYPWAVVFPLGTLVVNISGCFAIGVIAAISGPSTGRAWLKPEWRDFLMIGFCGGYTTFSSYGLQTLNLARDGGRRHVDAGPAGDVVQNDRQIDLVRKRHEVAV